MAAKKTKKAPLRRPSARRASPRVERRRSPRKKDDALYMRTYFAVFCLVISFSLMAFKLVWVGTVPVGEPRSSNTDVVAELPKRGNVYDRSGLLLATTLEVQSLYADPAMMLDVDEAVHKLSAVLPELNQEKIRKRLGNSKRRFSWVQRQLTPTQVKSVNDLGIPGLAFRWEEARIYPHQNLASHILGGMSVDGRGLAGIEKAYDEPLMRGEDITLTVDIRLQQQLRDSLLKQQNLSEAKAAWGVVLDPKTSDVLAMVSLPDYDPNRFESAPKEAWMNKVMHGAYEMGSTFKAFTVAQALEQGIATEETEFDCTKPIKVGRFKIRDSHPKYKWMTLEEVFKRSSNIGSARIADSFAHGTQREFFDSLNLLDPLEIGLGKTAAPMYPNRRWGRVHAMSMSYGHGIAISPMHLVSAIAAVANDGIYRTPHIVQNAVRQTPHRVVSTHTAKRVRNLLRIVVEEGTGRNARVAGYDIGGKTGTAEKNIVGGYSRDKNLASFVGMVPLENPQFVALMMVDEGKKDMNSGGTAAAPVFGEFVKKVAPIVAMRPQVLEQEYAKEYVEERLFRASF